MAEPNYDRWVEIKFDCLPLRSIGRFDIPLDASPKFRAHCERVKGAIQKHGLLNTYYLRNAECKFHVTNDAARGMLHFSFEGTIITDPDDLRTQGKDLLVELRRETCDWLTEPVVKWFCDTVPYAVEVEFNRYIEAGDLEKTKARMEQLRAQADSQGGFVGMYL
jgi:hypothetical protein